MFKIFVNDELREEVTTKTRMQISVGMIWKTLESGSVVKVVNDRNRKIVEITKP